MAASLNQTVTISAHMQDASKSGVRKGSEGCRSTTGTVTDIKPKKVIATCTCCRYKEQVS